jgi:chemotaxis protein CheX
MDAATINPFIEAAGQVFETMVHCRLGRDKPRFPDPDDKRMQLTAVIGLSGTVRGAVAMAFPLDTAQKVAQRLLGTDGQLSDADVVDALGEVANMVAGSAKAKFEGHEIYIGLPTVVRGVQYSLEPPRQSVTIVLPFKSEIGDFLLNVIMESEPARRNPAPAVCAAVTGGQS